MVLLATAASSSFAAAGGGSRALGYEESLGNNFLVHPGQSLVRVYSWPRAFVAFGEMRSLVPACLIIAPRAHIMVKSFFFLPSKRTELLILLSM